MDIALFCVFGFYSMCIFALTFSFMLDEFMTGHIGMVDRILYPGYPNHILRIDAWLHLSALIATVVVFRTFFSHVFPIFWSILTCTHFITHILENLHSSNYRYRFLFMSELALLIAYISVLISINIF